MLSRAGDSTYWMGRYIERAENNARLLDVNVQLLLDFEKRRDETERQFWAPILSTLEDTELFRQLHPEFTAPAVLDHLTFEPRNPNSIQSCIGLARENARAVRDQISSEMWEQINALWLYFREGSAARDFRANSHEFYDKVTFASQLFQGVTDATMTHGEAWQFVQAGKFIERADSTSRILDLKYHILLPSGEQVGGNVDISQWMSVLRSCSGMEAYLKIRKGDVTPWGVAEFLVCHGEFPRSIRFCIDRLDGVLHDIASAGEGRFRNEPERLSGLLRSQLDYATIDEVFRHGLHEYLDGIQEQVIGLDIAFHRTYCAY
ncbi:MAG: alpha-E domain-containing protein [Chthoniobacterales bacterium]|nr:alpha-E domain-containing protein [Chthoniobacterales bacterium]